MEKVLTSFKGKSEIFWQIGLILYLSIKTFLIKNLVFSKCGRVNHQEKSESNFSQIAYLSQAESHQVKFLTGIFLGYFQTIFLQKSCEDFHTRPKTFVKLNKLRLELNNYLRTFNHILIDCKHFEIVCSNYYVLSYPLAGKRSSPC